MREATHIVFVYVPAPGPSLTVQSQHFHLALFAAKLFLNKACSFLTASFSRAMSMAFFDIKVASMCVANYDAGALIISSFRAPYSL